MLLFARGEKRVGGVAGSVRDTTKADLHEVVVRSVYIREREQLHERVTAIDRRVFHEVAIVKECVHVPQKAMPRMVLCSPSKLNAEVIGWNVPMQTGSPTELTILKSLLDTSSGCIGYSIPRNLKDARARGTTADPAQGHCCLNCTCSSSACFLGRTHSLNTC